MRTRQLGSNGPEISVIGYGAWEAGGDAWGPNESDQVVIDAIGAGIDAGITWIDTAEVYGDGQSEELVGRAIEGRLKRLGIDAIDLYQCHWPDENVPVEDTWGAMAALQDDGLVRHIGVSNFSQAEIERCEAIRHVASLQPPFSMLDLRERDLIRWCGERGIGVVVYGPLAYGLLTGAITMETEFDESDWRSGSQSGNYRRMFAPGKREHSLAVVDRLRPIAERLGITVGQLALAWAVHQPGVTPAIAGSRNPGHVRDNAGAGDVELDQATLDEIEREAIPLGPDFA